MKVFLCKRNKLHGTLWGPYFNAFLQLPILFISPDSLVLPPAPVHPASTSFKSTKTALTWRLRAHLPQLCFSSPHPWHSLCKLTLFHSAWIVCTSKPSWRIVKCFYTLYMHLIYVQWRGLDFEGTNVTWCLCPNLWAVQETSVLGITSF